MKKVMVVVVLLSMALHCGARLGIIDRIYKERFHLALSFGFIEEIPITECSGNHSLTSITIKDMVTDDAPISATFFTQEINLFPPSDVINLLSTTIDHPSSEIAHYSGNYRRLHTSAVFHPPLA